MRTQGLFSLLIGFASCVKELTKLQKAEANLKGVFDSYDSRAMFVVTAVRQAYYVTANPVIVGLNERFNVIPNTMDLDSALNAFQCESPSCTAENCQGEGLRQSLSTNFTSNGTLFNLDQTYEVREGIRSKDTFQFITRFVGGVPFYLSNVTFMDSFYVFPKEQIGSDSTEGICEIGNGTFGLGRGMEGVMGQTIMSRFIEDAGAHLLAFFYNRAAPYVDGTMAILTDYEFSTNTPFVYPNLIPEWPLWTLPITNLYLGGLPLGGNGIGVIDAASTFLRMPKAYADLIAQVIGATPQETPAGTQYTMDSCDDPSVFPNITISIAGDSYDIVGSYYLKPMGVGCTILFMGTDSTYGGTPVWRLGYPFIVATGTILDYLANSITLIIFNGP